MFLCVRILDIVEDLMGNKHIVRNGSSGEEHGLVLGDDAAENRTESEWEYLRDDLVVHITQGNGPVVRNLEWVLDFRDKSYLGFVDRFRHNSGDEEASDLINYRWADRIPISLEEGDWEAIGSGGLVRMDGKESFM